MDDYERSLRQKSKVEVNDAKLSEVRVDLSKRHRRPEDLRPPKGTGSYHPLQDAPQASPFATRNADPAARKQRAGTP